MLALLELTHLEADVLREKADVVGMMEAKDRSLLRPEALTLPFEMSETARRRKGIEVEPYVPIGLEHAEHFS